MPKIRPKIAPEALDPVARELLAIHGPVIDTPTAARLSGFAEGSLQNMRSRGEGPVFYRRGRNGRRVAYDLLSVLDFARGMASAT